MKAIDQILKEAESLETRRITGIKEIDLLLIKNENNITSSKKNLNNVSLDNLEIRKKILQCEQESLNERDELLELRFILQTMEIKKLENIK